MTASQLAEQLAGDGLSRKHQSILLTTWHAGGESSLKPAAGQGESGKTSEGQFLVARNKTDECLAFLDTLDARILAQPDHIQWFDSKGVNTRRL